ncbi:MAG: sigma-70 family RNA polymerase sigma factor [Ignavibacteriales bacterium]|nr:sigma-70 family RNA polymerase sigma factor [Ignavibacteriales bacterium]
MRSPLTLLYSDDRILELIRNGNEDGLVKLYQQNRKMVSSYVAKNSGTPDDAEDMLQEALIILWERVRSGRYEQTAKLSTFIYATVKNLWSRKLARTRRESSGEIDGDNYGDGERSLLDRLIDRERVELVKNCMEKLGEQCRKLLLLYYWEELSMEQIASEMGFANADTVKSKKYQCKKQLEKFMKGLGAD